MYPYNLVMQEIVSIFHSEYLFRPRHIDMSKDNSIIDSICNVKSQREFNDYLFNYMQEKKASCLLAGYLENRTSLLRKYPQMIKEKRVFHLGLDVVVPSKTYIYAPVKGEIVISEYEKGEGNYGGLVVIKHIIENEELYTLYGHLDSNSLPTVGQIVDKSEKFAAIGDFGTNGNWFHHLHLQVLTREAFITGWVYKGYCKLDELDSIRKLCPDPMFLFNCSFSYGNHRAS